MTDWGQAQVVVVGAGHAGCEAALCCARLGLHTVLLTLNLDAVANMPCNPSIGGPGKSQLVREIDALGGQMGKAADATFLQSRMLNSSKGPAVHSLRVQSDRRAYQHYMRSILERQRNLELLQGEVVSLSVTDGVVDGVVTRLGQRIGCGAVILCTGTYLESSVIVGESCVDAGPDGLLSAKGLSANLRELGLHLQRFKTGTPMRIHRSSVDFSQLAVQPGDEPVVPFSFSTQDPGVNQLCCHLTYTNEETHRIIRENLHRSPLFGGLIQGIGPRYCPSIEDKVVRFADRERHQLFIEPMGLACEELYVQGLSSSLPVDVQQAMLKTVPGFEHARMTRCGYAIEYDCIDPTQLSQTLECRALPGLFGAGQFCGTSGYEEAAAQGLIAGINAAHKLLGRTPFVLGRDESYIGTLIDDIVLKGTQEPYRMMTARSEYRLLLRQDNADARLTPKGYALGLVSTRQYGRFLDKKACIEQEKRRLAQTLVRPSEEVSARLAQLGAGELSVPIRLSELLKRPQMTYETMAFFDPERPAVQEGTRAAYLYYKYEGYIRRQMEAVERFAKLEQTPLSPELDYLSMAGLRLEARQKLHELRPRSVGQASRITGVSPADISVLLVALMQQGGKT